MEIPIYQVDAFTGRPFGGNAAAVCPLPHWPEDQLMHQIAAENNLAETAFFVRDGGGFHLRWFTPEIEMDLCGHATLAAAHVLFNHLGHPGDTIHFSSMSGPLTVRRKDGRIELDFPARDPVPAELPPIIAAGIGAAPLEVLKARDYVLLLRDEAAVRSLKPDRQLLDRINIDPGGIIVTARGSRTDFVSRFFTPQAAIFEDPVTGSAHCSLVPYWAGKLGKTTLVAEQVSRRSGTLWCELAGDRVRMAGEAVTYLEGKIFLS
ncbi:MAG: Phenazine biosynthesis protein PhzF like [uncultured Cytophagales bacterium]|uniref:Phenazine biosynthesis protein PhzF like n=1 Tax=uncultured Cytophagales bacterium TaxID=158755 RepID=A0A6J4KQT2_9SPHI|nr:MAG: Phenazine biosynthesis protein PhzF like [uncultured Cytophagales bacterium]